MCVFRSRYEKKIWPQSRGGDHPLPRGSAAAYKQDYWFLETSEAIWLCYVVISQYRSAVLDLFRQLYLL